MKIYNERQNEAALAEIERMMKDDDIKCGWYLDELADAVELYESWKYPIGINVVQRAFYWLRWLLT